MQTPLQISYRHTAPSEALNVLIRQKASELEHFYRRITGCHVFVERPGQHHRKGKGAHFHVRIELTVPGEVLVAGRDPIAKMSHQDAFLAASEAFHSLRRQLEDYVRRRRERATSHSGASHGRVSRLYGYEGYGFIETADGGEVYFHRNSVLNGAFDRLRIGSEVRFTEEPGEKGPQASTVERVGAEGKRALSPPASTA